MKNVLVMYYTQSGQLLDIVKNITNELETAEDVNLDFYEIKLKENFPFPWNKTNFYDAFPESFLQIPRELVDLENPLLQKKYDSVNVSHINNLSSFVPKALFNDQNLADYLKFGHKIFKNDYIVYDMINNHELVNVYIPFVNINNFLIDKFGSFEYKHFSTVLIKNLLDIYKFSERPHMFVMVNETHFEIIAIANNSFQLYNSFSYKSKEDLIYYILFTAEQLNFNPNYFELIFLGETVEDDEIFDITYKYVRNINFLENRHKYALNKEFTEDMQRKYFTLLHQY